MKFLKYIILVAFVNIFTACETEIDLNLKTAEPRLVIDASIKEHQSCIVKLSMTQGFMNQDKPNTVSGAIITLEDSKGNSETLTETTTRGTYTSQMIGIAKETYTLTVEVDGEIHKATEYLPVAVPIESIRLYKMEVGNKSKYFPCITYNDPKGVPNYYLYEVYINDSRLLDPRPDDDKHSDGNFREPILAFNDEENNDKELNIGDYIYVELQSISKGAHRFFETIKSPGGVQNSNPESNFSGDVLGVFKTYSASSAEMTITEEDMQ